MNPWAWWRNRARRENELEEEIQMHLRLAERDRMERGETAAEARANVRREFGNVLQTKEVTRAQWGWVWLGQFSMNTRYVLRSLRRSPGFTLVSLMSLALGIGANTGFFSLIDALMLRALPVIEPDRLVQLVVEGDYFSNATWEQLRDRQNALSGVFAWGHTGFDLAVGGEKEPVEGLYVSGGYFNTLGVQALRGRVLVPDDDRRGGPLVAVISHAFREQQYGSDPQVIGRTIRVNGHPFTIVGITPPGFFGVDVGRRFDVAVPLASQTVFEPQGPLADRFFSWLSVMGRLKPGSTVRNAATGLNTLAPVIFEAAASPDLSPEERRQFLRSQFNIRAAGTGLSGIREHYARGLVLLLSIVGVVLFIACANLASLLLARADARRREIAVRLALGAGRAILIRQFLIESLLLAILGAALGVGLAQWGGRALVSFLDLSLDLAPDLRVLGFTAGLAIVTSLLFGFAPALEATRSGPNDALKEGSRGLTAGQRRAWSLGRTLVAAQVALSLLLMTGAGLLVRSLHTLLTQKMGFERNGVLLIDLDFTNTSNTPQQQTAVAEDLLARMQTLPGVVSASRSAVTPVSGMFWQWNVRVEAPGGQVRSEHVFFNLVSPGYFATMRTPLLAGRTFNSQDTATSLRVAIVNEAMARRLFPGVNPIGRVYRSDAFPGAPPKELVTEIVGLAGGAKYLGLRDAVPPTMYLPIIQNPPPFLPAGTYALRFTGPLKDLKTRVEQTIRAMNPRISLEFRLLSEQVEGSLLQERLVALLSALFGALALLLAAIGLYGLIAYSVTRRFHEIGVRMALGAGRGAVEWLVLREVGALLLGGLTLGVAATVPATHLVRSMLYGLAPNDPSTLTGACALLLMVGLAAAWIPVRRAARVDPMASLRHE
ncbi:MAG TPA: ABC transporter permease [Bryobacteraceae bacterium]|nr:ABC transporter permease [Bryobacteraceae bacterium]